MSARRAQLSVRDLAVEFRSPRGIVRAVEGLNFDVAAGSALGIVGESGCGKSVTALSILRLIQPPGRIASGVIDFESRDLLRLDERAMRKVRGREIAMVFQEPMSSLNPVYTVGAQIIEAIRLHQSISKSAARARAVELLSLVNIPSPSERIDAYPHQLSGGMRQRVMIAMALANDPKLLIADEPTTALDVTIQAQIMELLSELRRKLAMTVLLITHDLGLVAEFADEVMVMYAGRVVERAPVRDLFADPRHPYTQGLLRSVPSYGDNAERARLPTIAGMVPDLHSLGAGCRFADRCGERFDPCERSEPELLAVSGAASAATKVAETPTRLARCHLESHEASPRGRSLRASSSEADTALAGGGAA